jgi:hypothetical protein
MPSLLELFSDPNTPPLALLDGGSVWHDSTLFDSMVDAVGARSVGCTGEGVGGDPQTGGGGAEIAGGGDGTELEPASIHSPGVVRRTVAPRRGDLRYKLMIRSLRLAAETSLSGLANAVSLGYPPQALAAMRLPNEVLSLASTLVEVARMDVQPDERKDIPDSGAPPSTQQGYCMMQLLHEYCTHTRPEALAYITSELLSCSQMKDSKPNAVMTPVVRAWLKLAYGVPEDFAPLTEALQRYATVGEEYSAVELNKKEEFQRLEHGSQ